jgi:hypothetical protein
MKKLLFTLTLLFSIYSFGQNEIHSFSNPVSDSFIILASNHTSASEAIVVPDDKYFVVTSMKRDYGYWVYSSPEFYNDTGEFLDYLNSVSSVTGGIFLPAGTMIWFNNYLGQDYNSFVILTSHNYNTDTTLSSTNVELPNKIKLFPNPTTSEVTLNSDKQYDIEVFDMLGNKVMEFTGNSINMSNLSDAMYIVKAFDKIEKTSVSYKVIKN